MKEEYISLSVVGAVGLFSAGILMALMISNGVDAPLIITLVMVLVVVRADAREATVEGEYKRGWLVWRRTGPCRAVREARK